MQFYIHRDHFRNVKDYEENISRAALMGDLVAEISIRNPRALGGFEIIPYSPTILSQVTNGRLGGSFLQFYIHRDNFRAWLKKNKQWPLADNCLLAKWYEHEPQAKSVADDGGGSQVSTEPAYIKYEKSLDAWIEKTGINLEPLIVQDIFNQVKLFDDKLWTIKLVTFTRDIWPKYRDSRGLKKQPGRPTKK